MRTILLLAAALVLAGCSAPADEQRASLVVSAIDNQFVGTAGSVGVGDTVVFRNDGQNPHGLAIAALAIDEVIAPGETREVRFDAAGQYQYVCPFHAGMSGALTVGGDATPAAPVGATPTAPTNASAPAPVAGQRNVTIVDDAFTPASVTVNAGGRVAWTNRGGGHSVTFSALPIDHVFRSGESFSARFDAEGTYAYVCKFHNDMRGTVNVVAADVIVNESADAPTIVLDRGHYDELVVEVANGTPVTWQNPRAEDVTVELREPPQTLLVPAGGSASLTLPPGEHWWRELDAGEEWRADDHDVGIVRVRSA